MALRLDLCDQPHFQPVMRSPQVVAQQSGRLVHIQDQNVEVAVVVKITEGAAATGVRRCYPRARIGDLLKRAVRQIAKENARRLVGILGEELLDFGIDAARNEKKCPASRRCRGRRSRLPNWRIALRRQFCGKRTIVEVARAVVVIKNVGIFGEMVLKMSRWPSRA